MDGNHGKERGDPDRAAAAAITALDAETTPVRLVLGSDAIGNIRDRLTRVGDALASWEAVGRATAVDE